MEKCDTEITRKNVPEEPAYGVQTEHRIQAKGFSSFGQQQTQQQQIHTVMKHSSPLPRNLVKPILEEKAYTSAAYDCQPPPRPPKRVTVPFEIPPPAKCKPRNSLEASPPVTRKRGTAAQLPRFKVGSSPARLCSALPRRPEARSFKLNSASPLLSLSSRKKDEELQFTNGKPGCFVSIISKYKNTMNRFPRLPCRSLINY